MCVTAVLRTQLEIIEMAHVICSDRFLDVCCDAVLVQGDTNAMGQGTDGLGRGAGSRRASWGCSRVTLRENTEEARDQVDAGAKCAGWNQGRNDS